MPRPIELEVFSDYVCPYCWLAEPALVQLLESVPDLVVVRRAYELRPEPFPQLDPRGDYLKRSWSNFVNPLAERLGVTMTLPPVQPRTRLAHQAAHWARAEGRMEDFHRALFRAFFERGDNIGEIGVLTAVAAELGMASDRLAEALDARRFEPAVLEDQHQAEALGIGVVPAFVAGRAEALSGVQPVEQLRALVNRVRGSMPGD